MSEHVTTHTDPSDIVPSLMAPVRPHVIVLFGATGDLARRKLLPGLLHLSLAGDCRIVGTSLDEFDDEGFRKFARIACDQFSNRMISTAEECVRSQAAPSLENPRGDRAVADAETELGGETDVCIT
jgi:glucose-6-phosphate 1-dehydrogenase